MYQSKVALNSIIIWLAPRAAKMTQVARCAWLPERARWSHLARSGLPAVSRKKNFPESHKTNPLLTNIQPSSLHTWSITDIYGLSGYFTVKVQLELSQHKHEVCRVFPVQLTGQSYACQFRVGTWS